MSIEIRVIDPKNTDPADIKNVIRFLASAVALTVSFSDSNGTISPEDRPDAGRDMGNGQSAPSFAGAGTSMNVPGATPGTSLGLMPGMLPSAPGAAVPGLPAALPSAAPATGVEVDSAGFPYNPRIHAGTKTRNADGQGKKRKGVDDATVAQVQGELRQLMAAPAASFAAVLPTAPGAGMSPLVPAATPAVPGLPAGLAFGGALPNGQLPFVPPTGQALSNVPPGASDGGNGTIAPSVAPQIPGAPTMITFPLLMAKINTAVMANQLNEAAVQQVLISLGLPPQPAMLVQRPDLVPQVAQMIFGTTAP